VTVDCSEATAMLDELALDVLPGDQRTAVLAHVEECGDCRQVLDELCEAADELLLAAPTVEPPAGFGDRVLERTQGQGRRADVAPPRRRLPVWMAAAAAAVFLVLGGVTGAVVGRSTGDGDSGKRFRTVQLISTTSGADIGEVWTYASRPSWVFMQVDKEVPDGTYRCMLEMDDGSTVPIGRLYAVKGNGGWGEHVDVDPRRARQARLLDRDGTVIATAQLG
jgi:hypothetical protein